MNKPFPKKTIQEMTRPELEKFAQHLMDRAATKGNQLRGLRQQVTTLGWGLIKRNIVLGDTPIEVTAAQRPWSLSAERLVSIPARQRRNQIKKAKRAAKMAQRELAKPQAARVAQ